MKEVNVDVDVGKTGEKQVILSDRMCGTRCRIRKRLNYSPAAEAEITA